MEVYSDGHLNEAYAKASPRSTLGGLGSPTKFISIKWLFDRSSLRLIHAASVLHF